MSEIFYQAIQKGDLDTVGKMIAADPTLLHTKAKDGLSPILTAAYHRHYRIADLLIDHTVTITIFEAAATGRAQQVSLFLARQPDLINTYAPDGFQALGLATFLGHINVVDYLLKAGAWVNEPSRNELLITPLHSAVVCGYSQIAYRLLEAGADPNLRQGDGYTPLHIAAMNNLIEMIRLLLNYGADLQVTDKNGKTALELANEKGHNLAATLLRAGITRRFRKPRSAP